MKSVGQANSYWAAGVAVAVLNIIAYGVHAGVSGSFALPPGWLAVLGPLDPVITLAAGFITHGLLTGDWTWPTVPTKAHTYAIRSE